MIPNRKPLFSSMSTSHRFSIHPTSNSHWLLTSSKRQTSDIFSKMLNHEFNIHQILFSLLLRGWLRGRFHSKYPEKHEMKWNIWFTRCHTKSLRLTCRMFDWSKTLTSYRYTEMRNWINGGWRGRDTARVFEAGSVKSFHLMWHVVRQI